MALHDFACGCGYRAIDYYIPATLRASEHPPTCPTCWQPMAWIPQVGRMDAREPFQQFQTYIRQPDGSEQLTTIGSLHQMRQIERESEQRQKDGEGQQMVWRDYSQDRNHTDRHAFATDPSAAPDPAFVRRAQPRAVEAEQADAAYGPGVSDSNASPLGVE